MIFTLMAVQPGRTHGIDIGAIVRRAIRLSPDEDFTQQKAAAITMGTSMSQLSRSLDGQPGYPIDLWKVAELPVEIQAHVYARILEAVHQKKRMAKAGVPPRSQTEVA